MVPQVLGSFLIKHISVKNAQRIGTLLYSAIVILLMIALQFKSLYGFIILSILGGLIIGLIFSASMDSIISKISKEESSSVLATIYLISYSGTAAPNLFIGVFGSGLTLMGIFSIYCIITLLATIIYMDNYKKRSKEHMIIFKYKFNILK